MKKKYFDLRTLIILALLAAIGAVLKAFIPGDYFFGDTKIVDVSFIALPVMLAGIYFGPMAGGIVGFVAESVGYFMLPVGGAFNPLFSLIMALLGIISGLFYMKSRNFRFLRISFMVILSQILCSGILTTLVIHWFYGVPLAILMPGRGIGLLIKIPVLTALLVILVERLKPILKKTKKASELA